MAWWRAHLSAGSRRTLGGSWPWFYVACLALSPGILLIGHFLHTDSPTLTISAILCAFGFLPLAILAGFARDAQCRAEARA